MLIALVRHAKTQTTNIDGPLCSGCPAEVSKFVIITNVDFTANDDNEHFLSLKTIWCSYSTSPDYVCPMANKLGDVRWLRE